MRVGKGSGGGFVKKSTAMKSSIARGMYHKQPGPLITPFKEHFEKSHTLYGSETIDELLSAKLVDEYTGKSINSAIRTLRANQNFYKHKRGRKKKYFKIIVNLICKNDDTGDHRLIPFSFQKKRGKTYERWQKFFKSKEFRHVVGIYLENTNIIYGSELKLINVVGFRPVNGLRKGRPKQRKGYKISKKGK